ncbi:MAG: CheR family methyltransferase [Frankiaceae bacterium]
MSVAAGDFDYIAQLVRRRSAIVLEPGKEYLVESRLLPVARRTGDGSVSELVARLRTQPDDGLQHEVVDAMTTNETSWFRDRHPFDALASRILPDLLARRAAQREISIWSAGCSSGQEPYSIAMILHGQMSLHPGWQVSILATDLSREMLAKARAGRYGQLEVNRGLPATMLVSHFDRAGIEWVVKDRLRQLVEFRPLNLAEPVGPVLPRFDVVFLRNVLIYFDHETKRRVLAQVRRVLRPDGYLFLGGAETTLNVDDAFMPVQYDRATCYRLRGGEAPS